MFRYILATLLLAGLAHGRAKRPNILFILTDDQDLHMDSVEHMPNLRVRSPADRSRRHSDPDFRI